MTSESEGGGNLEEMKGFVVTGEVGLGIGSVGSNERGWDWTCS